ncbi:hypothetical protein QAD02_009084 [Eretmocerus hayati]|uniref:Uncharacterized protein n=1 Tax=Eretmocerus hayati TaxID=131215 RepID=A0ACC2N9Q3_9HYME|nr:hypothetical protein QAD02_009084 [Eretmocerus hayati]
MESSIVTAVVLYLLCFISCVTATQEDDAVGEYLTYEDNKFFVSKNVTRKDNTFLLASCNKEKFPQEIDCNITIMRLPSETEFHDKGTTITTGATFYRNCNLTSTLVDGRTLMVKQFPLELDFLGITSKALITWNELSSDSQAMYKKIAILDISSCQAKFIDLSYFKHHPIQHVAITNLIIHRTTFDVFISDKIACRGLDKCRLTYNQWGDMEGYPTPFTTSLFMFKTIMAPDKISAHPGFYVFVASRSTEPYEVIVEHIGEYGDVRKRLTTTVRHNTKISHLITSTANGQFTICGRLAKQTICDQFNAGTSVPKLSYAHEHASESDVAIDVYNLMGSGYLLLTISCGDFTKLSCSEFKVSRVKNSRSTDLISKIAIELNCNDDLNHLGVDTSEDNDTICFHLLCMSSRSEDGRTTASPNSLIQCIPNFQII